ncbi:response regulator [Aquabacterium sp.]|uniref:response regulator n=1 Tax=Aquabacterium sp. TaxID=1872578 RepID=UPI002B68CB7B|nr:response regulator [Aquabacterium sp.]HSW08964.1 response regulator [Aquabacterium sp.]
MNPPARLLIVDDEPELVEVLQEYFADLGHAVQTAANALQARVLMTAQPPDLAILDIRMPGEDGLSLARWAREHCPRTGLIMLTTTAQVIDRIVGLEIGADDYLGKPFDMRELQARVTSVLRRRELMPLAPVPLPPGTAVFGRCRLNLAHRKLYGPDGVEIPITSMEFDLLQVLSDNPNRVLNRDQLMERAHHKDWDVYDRSIDLRIMRLRRKIEPDPTKPEVIKTVRGAGYMYVRA